MLDRLPERPTSSAEMAGARVRLRRSVLKEIRQEQVARTVEFRHDRSRSEFAKSLAGIHGTECQQQYLEQLQHAVKLSSTVWDVLYRTQMSYFESCSRLAASQSRAFDDYLALLYRAPQASRSSPGAADAAEVRPAHGAGRAWRQG
jgi:hypothetical protein